MPVFKTIVAPPQILFFYYLFSLFEVYITRSMPIGIQIPTPKIILIIQLLECKGQDRKAYALGLCRCVMAQFGRAGKWDARSCRKALQFTCNRKDATCSYYVRVLKAYCSEDLFNQHDYCYNRVIYKHLS